MSEYNSYILPNKAGEKLILGQIIGAANAIECAAIVNQYQGPILLIVSDMQCTMKLYNEIRQFTSYPVLTIPDWETLPYDRFSPQEKIISDRISTFFRLTTLTHGIIILPINTVMQLVCPRNFLLCHTRLITKGQNLSQDTLRTYLEYIGYQNVDKVLVHGELASRKSLIDIYPMGHDNPYRISFFNNKINRLCIFDINSQRSIKEVKTINLLPAHEFPTHPAAIELFRTQWRTRFTVQLDAEHIYQQVNKGTLPAGIEYWQPLFFNKPLVSLFSFLPTNSLVINIGVIEDHANRFWKDVCKRYDECHMDPMRPPLPPQTLWLQVDNLFTELKRWPRVQFHTQTISQKVSHYNMNYQSLPLLSIDYRSKTPMNNLYQFYSKFNGVIIFSVENKGRRETLIELLAKVNILPKIIHRLENAVIPGTYLIISACEYGFINTTHIVALICENDLFGDRIKRNWRDNSRKIKNNIVIRNLAELHEGQLVVHLEHGVGRYAGMTTLETGGIQAEYLIINYAENDKLYVTISSLHLLNQYTGNTDKNVPLQKLGSNNWIRIKQKASERIRDVAVELLDIYAQRKAKNGFAFHYSEKNYQLFCEECPFTPTITQIQAINAVIHDMCQPITMDRLICGDVGFGKTEVAMRAAFLAIENHKQVAMLVPTTLLAQQHFDNFRDRFANWPVYIEMLSRFRDMQEQSEILQKTITGKINILIGTHKLLQRNIKWHDLGLLIVDEEHRFGVLHKEHIKTMCSNIDILTLTSTPIPRTLHMAMSGIRDLSIISTPPAQRLAIKTFVLEYDALVLREAIMRELLRGGQVYYLYNDIKNIEKIANCLEKLVPEARIAISHGQLRKHDLERVMNDFYHQRFNVLVCTTIIETGIDIATVNTIIIERADHFGLAQLHQLRGRVGRSYHQAYAYLLIPPRKVLNQDAHKRLDAILSMRDLGAGFILATHDLEVRGAGELLGKDQSGQIEIIGFALYTELLKKAVDALKVGQEPSLENLTRKMIEVELRIPTILPKEYIPNVNTRLSLYKRINSATNDDEISNLKEELIDRFGQLPDPANYLLTVSSLRQRAQQLGIRRIEGHAQGGFIEFNDNHFIDPHYLINLLTNNPTTYRLDGPTRLKFSCNLIDHQKRIRYIDHLLLELQQHKISILDDIH